LIFAICSFALVASGPVIRAKPFSGYFVGHTSRTYVYQAAIVAWILESPEELASPYEVVPNEYAPGIYLA